MAVMVHVSINQTAESDVAAVIDVDIAADDAGVNECAAAGHGIRRAERPSDLAA